MVGGGENSDNAKKRQKRSLNLFSAFSFAEFGFLFSLTSTCFTLNDKTPVFS